MKKLDMIQMRAIGSAKMKLSTILITVIISFCGMRALPAAENISKIHLLLVINAEIN